MRMRLFPIMAVAVFGAGFLGSWAVSPAQDAPRFTRIRALTNAETALTLAVTNGQTYRLDTSTQLGEGVARSTLLSFTANGSSMLYTDTAAPYLERRFYSAAQMLGSNFFTGDHFATSNGEVIVRPLNHATFLMNWNGKVIYNDPVAAAGPFTSFPKADLILVSHTHTDHFSPATLDAVRGTNVIIIAPRAATNTMSLALRNLTITLNNGDTTDVMGLRVDAIPAYNSNHPLGTGNGYVLTIADRRFYASGDTGPIPETRALSKIDVAFLCMNIPFTMDSTNAASVLRDFRPTVVYPYHYRNSDGTFPDFNDFKRRVGHDLGIEVRLRKWY